MKSGTEKRRKRSHKVLIREGKTHSNTKKSIITDREKAEESSESKFMK